MDVRTFTCSTCNGVSTIGTGNENNVLLNYGCKEKIHEQAEDSAPLTSCFKCQLCNRTELKTRDGKYYSGCNMFETHKDLGIVGFHDVCFRMASAKMLSGAKTVQ